MFGMHSIKFRVLTKFKPPRLLELNGRRWVSKSHKFHGTSANYNCLPGNQRHDDILKPKFNLIRTDHPWIRTYSGYSIFLSYGIFNPIDPRTTEKQAEFLLNSKVKGTPQLRRCHCGDSKKNSEDYKPKSACFKRKPVKEFNQMKSNYTIPDNIGDPKKIIAVNKRKCGKTPEELRKCLKTLQDIVDFVHPMMPYVS